jgi:3-phenylpropionate/cinnamic acid dioxygenase small subunit
VADLTDREQIVELLARYASIPDTRDWDELPKSVFADRVVWDFESLGAEPAFEVDRDMLMARVRTAFAEWQATHHSITNHQVSIDGDVAVIRAHIHAQHWLAPDVAVPQRNRWLVVGFYDDEAVRTPDGWRLSKVRLTPMYQEHPERLTEAEHTQRPEVQAEA